MLRSSIARCTTALRSSHTTTSTPLRTLHASATMSAPGPLEQAITNKITASLQPTHFTISNDSASHRHHAPMKEDGAYTGETHFTVQVVSEKFEGLRAIARHRLVNDLLKDEFNTPGGLHALAIKAKSPKEFEA